MRMATVQVRKGDQVFTGKVIDTSPTTAMVRVHWLLYEAPLRDIAKYFSQFGDVQSAQMKRSTVEGMEHIGTLVRVVVIKNVTKEKMQKIPYTTTFQDPKGNSFEVLITMNGRKPMCLRCKKIGHIRRDWLEILCNNCGRTGHYTDECTYQPSWAQRVSRDHAVVDDDAMETSLATVKEQEKSLATENDKPVEAEDAMALATVADDSTNLYLATGTESLSDSQLLLAKGQKSPAT